MKKKQSNLEEFKKKCYHLSDQFAYVSILDSCNQPSVFLDGRFEFLAAFSQGSRTCQSLLELNSFAKNEWVFGAISYDVKNEVEDLESKNASIFNWPDLMFFKPDILVAIDRDGTIKNIIGELPLNNNNRESEISLGLAENKISREEYIKDIEKIRMLIEEGEVYELNYCKEYSYSCELKSAVSLHQRLLERSPSPMAAFLKVQAAHLLSASMERFICNRAGVLTSQPIKGTIKRGANLKEDEELQAELAHSEKDKAENVMIVDLVRNDLKKCSESGTIKVDELFGIYAFRNVYHMISTITSTLKEGLGIEDVIRSTFPMGSMTGAPKIAAMKYIEELEDFKRSWYAGSTGYIQPNGDFDFNVVIRSMFYDSELQKLSFCAGGAITYDSDAQKEWEELNLKTKGIKSVLNVD